jgi:hypothetical protein
MRAFAAVLAVAALIASLYGRAIELWWTWDDAYLLHLAGDSRLRDIFFSAQFWHSQPNQHFFPFFLSILKGMIGVFGVEAAPLYVLNLAGMALFGAALYALLRLWLGPAAALAGAALVLAGTPMSELASKLSALHYAQALALATAAAIVHVIGARRQSIVLAFVSAALYLLALVIKEVVMPLPLVLLLLPEKRSAVAFALHLEALAIFLAARTVLVGSAFSAYGFALPPSELLLFALAAPWQVLRAVLGPQPLVAIGLAVLLIAVIAPALRDRRLAVAAVACIGVAIFGTLPVAKAFEPRHAVLLWLTLAILFVIAARERWPLIAAVFGLAVIANRGQWAIDLAAAQRQSSEGRAFVTLEAGEALAYPSIPPAAMSELRWLKESRLGGSPGAEWFYDDLFLCEGGGGAVRRFVSWQPATRTVETVTPQPRCEQARQAPMTLSFHHRGDRLFWTFGPYRDGEWKVVMDEGRQSFAVPAADGFHLPGVRAMSLRVRYDSPEGWRTYSPVMALDFVREPDRAFTR